MRYQSIFGFAALAFGISGAADPLTPIHEKGRCAFRSTCGKKGFFGKELPCVDNGVAHDPASEAGLREELVDLCGEEWNEGPVCCTLAQVSFCYVKWDV